jgi:hypothetical protein
MNKYALGTIVGTALLSLAKSKSGASARLKTENVYEIRFEEVIVRIPSDSFHGIVECIADMLKEQVNVAFFGIYNDGSGSRRNRNEELFQMFKPTKVTVDVEETGNYEADEDQEIELSFEEISEQDSEERQERLDEYWNNEWEDKRDILVELNISFTIETPKNLSAMDEDNEQYDDALYDEAREMLKALINNVACFPASLSADEAYDQFSTLRESILTWDDSTQSWKPYIKPESTRTKLRKR